MAIAFSDSLDSIQWWTCAVQVTPHLMVFAIVSTHRLPADPNNNQSKKSPCVRYSISFVLSRLRPTRTYDFCLSIQLTDTHNKPSFDVSASVMFLPTAGTFMIVRFQAYEYTLIGLIAELILRLVPHHEMYGSSFENDNTAKNPDRAVPAVPVQVSGSMVPVGLSLLIIQTNSRKILIFGPSFPSVNKL